MTTRYPIVFEAEDSGAVSAYVPGLPVYAAADTADEAQDAARELLALYVEDR
jgi:predicted RNase H-like HicB family nuclease